MRTRLIITAILAGALALNACSGGGDDPTAPTTLGVDLSRYGDAIASVAPAAYDGDGKADVLTDDAAYEFLLGDVVNAAFSAHESTSLYRSVENLDAIIGEVEHQLASWEMQAVEGGDGDGAQDDQAEVGEPEDLGSVTVYPLDGDVVLPAGYPAVFGQSVDVDYVIIGDWGDGSRTHFGFKQTETSETVFCWHAYGDNTEIFLGERDLESGALTMHGCGVGLNETCQDLNQSLHSIHTGDGEEFEYRMCWHAFDEENCADFSYVGSIIGGGDANDEFAFRYASLDESEDFRGIEEGNPYGMLTRVFGADYGNRGSDVGAYGALTRTDQMFDGGDLPFAQLGSPFAALIDGLE